MSHTLLGIIFLILSAVFHAAWNFLAKRSKTPSKEYFLLANTVGIIACLPILFFTPFSIIFLPHEIAVFILFAGLFESFYFTTLSKCYSYGDLSITYPISRAFPVIFVILFSILYDHTPISMHFIFGCSAVVIGAFILPMTHFNDFSLKKYSAPSCQFAYLTALACTGYLIVDSKALALFARHNPSISFPTLAIFYSLIRACCISFFLSIPVITNKNSRRHFIHVIRESFKSATITGTCMTLTYTLVLISMILIHNISYVTVLRQLSIPLTALLGIYMNKETNSVTKWLGVITMFFGIVIASG